MKAILNRLINNETLTREEAKSVLVEISLESYNHSQIASFLTIFMMRSITIQELEGFRDALLELCLKLDFDGYELTDFCGTGGDGKDTFNISTLSAFVAAGAGLKVAKHSNYGVSSGCGSSNVLEAIGVKLSNNSDFCKKAIDEAGIVLLHAPLFHPAMKNVAPIRKDLGIKTFFNMLGPLSNPVFTKNQITGVFNLKLARVYGYLFQNTEKRYAIVHALDGYDELSLTGDAKVISNANEKIISPSDFGLDILNPKLISGGENIESSKEIFLKIIQGQGADAQIDVVCANAGLAIVTAKGGTLKEGYEKAKESLLGGHAYNTLKQLQKISEEA